MKGCSIGLAAASLGCVFSQTHAGFVSFVVSSQEVSYGGNSLIVYTLAARFDGTTDTAVSCSNLTATNDAWFTGFWHKDKRDDPALDGVLSQEYGTWNPRSTGSSTENRPYDSYLTIGGVARYANITRARAGAGGESSLIEDAVWNRPDLPPAGGIEWYNDSDFLDGDSFQGRVGNSPGLPGTDVRVGQFVLSAGHEARTFSLDLKFTTGKSLSDECHAVSGEFTLGAVPGPGALSMLALVGLTARFRRR